MSVTVNHLLDSLGWALLHSLWQGGIAFLLVVGLRFVMKNKTPSARYMAQMGVLVSCFVAFLLTLTLYLKTSGLSTLPTGVVPSATIAEGITVNSFEQTVVAARMAIPNLAQYTPLIALFWCLGFLVMALRYATAYALTNRLRSTGLIEPSKVWRETFKQLLRRSNLKGHVDFYISEYVEGPMTLGFLKPVVLVPVGFLSRLPSDQVEAILLHEIGHIRRYDYAVNLVQTAIRTVFFYHPAIHYISKQIDIDREQACDDFACERTPSPTSLVKGLAALSIPLSPNMAMAAVKRDMPILDRLKRLTGYSETNRRPDHAILSAVTAVLICAAYVGAVTKADAHPPKEPKAPVALKAELPETVVKAKPAQAPVAPKPPKLYDFPQTTIDKTTFKKYLKKDKEAQRSFDKKLVSYGQSLWAYSKANNLDEAVVEAMAEEAKTLSERFEDKLESRRDVLESRYEAYVEAMNANKIEVAKTAATAKSDKVSYTEKNRLANHEQFRAEVMGNLYKDGLIKSKSETVFLSHPNNTMSLNGKALPKTLGAKYCKILEKNGIYDNDVEITIKPKNITVLTDYDGERHTTKITYGEWSSKDEVKSNYDSKAKSYVQANSTSKPNPVIKKSKYKQAKYVWPSDSQKVSAEFGIKNKFWPQSHKGIDIPAATGTPVYATAEGVVEAAFEDEKYGLTIIIKHKDNRESLYAHLNKIKVKQGQQLRRGQVIGHSGNTGASTGPHLHFEVRENGQAINPRTLLGNQI